MSYKIRYAPCRWREKRRQYGLGFQVIGAAALLVLGKTAGSAWLDRWLTPTGGALETALAAAAAELTAGEGWYDAAVAFGRMLLAAAGA